MTMPKKQPPFWETTPLEKMTHSQWEAVCDCCGRCCLHKLEDEETGEVFYTNVACRLMDMGTCRCMDYPERTRQVPSCLVLTPAKIGVWHWLPETCAYRRLAEGKGLEDWHPLLSGDPRSVHRAGKSIRGQVVGEDTVSADQMAAHIIYFDEEG